MFLKLSFVFGSILWFSNALAADVSPAMPKGELQEKCEAKGGEYIEDGDDFYGCELPNNVHIGCLDWYGCIAWSESRRGGTVRDHRLYQSFGILNVMSKPTMAQSHPNVAVKYAAYKRSQ